MARCRQDLFRNPAQAHQCIQYSQFRAGFRHAISDNGGITGLASIGVNMENDGTLTVDDTKLSSIVSNNLAQLRNLFQSVKPVGFGSNFASDLAQMISSSGPIQSDLAQIAHTQKDLTDRINTLEDRLTVKQTQLIHQYSQVNAALQEFPLLMAAITGQLDALKSNS